MYPGKLFLAIRLAGLAKTSASLLSGSIWGSWEATPVAAYHGLVGATIAREPAPTTDRNVLGSVSIREYVQAGIEAGDSDEDIKQNLVERYGRGILFEPNIAPSTLPL